MSDFTEQIKTENKKLLATNEQLQKENKRLLSSNEQVSSSINSGKIQIEGLKKSKEKIIAEIESFVSKRDEALQALSSVELELNVKKETLSKTLFGIKLSENKQLEIIKASNEKLNQFNLQYNDIVSASNEEIESKRKEISQLSEKIDTLNKNYEQAVKEYEILKEKSLKTTSDLNTAVFGYESKISALKKEVDYLEEKVSTNKSIFDEVVQLKNLSIGLTNSKHSLEEEIEEIRLDLAGFDKMKIDLSDEISELQKKKEQADNEYQTSKKKVFAIAEREASLAEKEEFVKSKFQEAGLIYE
jgi:chromosome segregation ATPase